MNMTIHCVDPAHIYELGGGQTVRFLKKERVSPESTELRLVYDGTTNEELLEVLIDRTQTLQVKFPCDENLAALTYMHKALAAFNERTRRRQSQNVEGTDNPHTS
jgi:hypothetical protein